MIFNAKINAIMKNCSSLKNSLDDEEKGDFDGADYVVAAAVDAVDVDAVAHGRLGALRFCDSVLIHADLSCVADNDPVILGMYLFCFLTKYSIGD